MSIRNLQTLYNIEDINFLRYLKIKMDTLDFMKNSNSLNEPTLRPAIPHHTKIFYKSIKGAKDFYKYAQCSLKNEHSMKENGIMTSIQLLMTKAGTEYLKFAIILHLIMF